MGEPLRNLPDDDFDKVGAVSIFGTEKFDGFHVGVLHHRRMRVSIASIAVTQAQE